MFFTGFPKNLENQIDFLQIKPGLNLENIFTYKITNINKIEKSTKEKRIIFLSVEKNTVKEVLQ